jgi:hypothetical protein
MINGPCANSIWQSGDTQKLFGRLVDDFGGGMFFVNVTIKGLLLCHGLVNGGGGARHEVSGGHILGRPEGVALFR